MKEKKRPTLEELENLPRELWALEVAQISVDASAVQNPVIEQEANDLMLDPDLTPEKIIALREKLKSGSGSTLDSKPGGTGSTPEQIDLHCASCGTEFIGNLHVKNPCPECGSTVEKLYHQGRKVIA